VERYRDEIRKNIPEVDAVVGTGELEAILAAAGLMPKPQPVASSPFNILPQGTPEATIHTHPIGKAQTDAEVAELESLSTQQLIARAPSAVNQHSRPLTDPDVAPQLKIVQSLAETGTTHGDEPLAHSGNHIAHIPNAGTKSRAEGDLREQQGRFSRETWDGASSTLPDYLYSDATPRILTTPRASAYIKIAEGCDHPCSFCIIPQLRGKFRSRRMSSIIAEAENLIAQGVREITLIGQDTTCYGEDLGFTDGLATLLDALAVLPDLKWLRFLYTYPNKVTTRLLETMAKHANIAPYLDVPLQHASPSVLKRMKRGGSPDIFLKLIENARRTVPGIVIRTSFIVGFPGETEEDFTALCEFTRVANIDWLGVFTYSDEEGAKAFELADELKVPRRTIQSRRNKLMKLQQKISAKSKAAWVGREIDILVEGPSEETELLWEGRSILQAPEIDGKVLINDFGPHETLVPGTFYRAEINESHDYDVVARIIE
jgi:ribosomal protein S12 methylthiotransferase